MDGEITRARLGKIEVLERVFEAALDQPSPAPELKQAVQAAATFMRHRHRDKGRDPHQGLLKRRGPEPRPFPEGV